MNCPKCGGELYENSNFCPKCKSFVDGEVAQSTNIVRQNKIDNFLDRAFFGFSLFLSSVAVLCCCAGIFKINIIIALLIVMVLSAIISTTLIAIYKKNKSLAGILGGYLYALGSIILSSSFPIYMVLQDNSVYFFIFIPVYFVEYIASITLCRKSFQTKNIMSILAVLSIIISPILILFRSR